MRSSSPVLRAANGEVPLADSPVHMLVYYEVHATYVEAARREKRLKNWRRQWKLNLIETINPNGMIYMKIFAVDWDHLNAADKPRHVGGGDEL